MEAILKKKAANKEAGKGSSRLPGLLTQQT